MEAKYLLVANGKVLALNDRPTQEQIKERGAGEYILRRGDGTLIKRFRVAPNRNGNLAITAESPRELEGISTLNLNRMLRDYTRIVKLWPVQAKATKAISTELTARQFIMEQA